MPQPRSARLGETLVLVGRDYKGITVSWTTHSDLLEKWLYADSWEMSPELVDALSQDGANPTQVALIANTLAAIAANRGRSHTFGSTVDKKCLAISEVPYQGTLNDLGALGSYRTLEYEII